MIQNVVPFVRQERVRRFLPVDAAAAEPAAERRESERTIRHWKQQAEQFGSPPPLQAFELSRVMSQDWAYRFLVSADAVVENHAFLIYGHRFAQLLDLPDMPVPQIPMVPQLPAHYRPVFSKGCRKALAEAAPVRTSGRLRRPDGRFELYRAAFLPVALRPNSLTQLVYGAFNRRIVNPQPPPPLPAA